MAPTTIILFIVCYFILQPPTFQFVRLFGPSLLDKSELELKEALNFAGVDTKHRIIADINGTTCSSWKQAYVKPPCHKSNSDKCVNDFLPSNPRDRVASMLLRKNLHISPAHRHILKEMQAKVDGFYDLIVVSAVSSNHFTESQAMLKNLHETALPALAYLTIAVVVYDIGLSESEKVEYETYCRCKLIRFPFERFPPHFKTLKCFGWKPVVVRAHADNCHYVMWMDASVRFLEPEGLLKSLTLADTYGVQQNRATFIRNPFRALPSIFHFFGDSPCAHLSFAQAESNWGIYRRSPLVTGVILDSWAACGLQAACTCPVDPRLVQSCRLRDNATLQIGYCMRPQSAISIILSKLYLEHYYAVARYRKNFMRIARGDKFEYFKHIAQS